MKFEDLTSTVMSVIIVVLMIAVVLIPVMADALADIGEGYETVVTVLKLVPLFLAIAVIWLVMKMFVNTKN